MCRERAFSKTNALPDFPAQAKKRSAKNMRMDANIAQMRKMKLKAFILTDVNLGCQTEALQALRKIQGYNRAYYVLGDYDIITDTSSNTINELNQVVSNVRKIQNVKSTSTMITGEL